MTTDTIPRGEIEIASTQNFLAPVTYVRHLVAKGLIGAGVVIHDVTRHPMGLACNPQRDAG